MTVGPEMYLLMQRLQGRALVIERRDPSDGGVRFHVCLSTKSNRWISSLSFDDRDKAEAASLILSNLLAGEGEFA